MFTVRATGAQTKHFGLLAWSQSNLGSNFEACDLKA